MTDRKKPGVAFWASVVVVVILAVAYPLSIGPACWLANRDVLPAWTDSAVKALYSPLMWCASNSETASDAYAWYVGFWVDDSDNSAEIL